MQNHIISLIDGIGLVGGIHRPLIKKNPPAKATM